LTDQPSVEYHQAVVETVQTFLDAGCEMGGGAESLNTLLTGSLRCCPIKYSSSLAVTEHYNLIVELFKLFWKHNDKHGIHFDYTSRIISIAGYQVFGVPFIPSSRYDKFVDRLNVIVDALGDIFRFLLCTGSGVNTTDVNYDKCTERGDLIQALVSIAQYSSMPNCSRKLMRLILYTLTATQRVGIEKMVSKRLASTMESQSPGNVKSINSWSYTLAWIRGAQPPRGLQHLARHTICSSLSGRNLPSAKTLEIPDHLHSYLAQICKTSVVDAI